MSEKKEEEKQEQSFQKNEILDEQIIDPGNEHNHLDKESETDPNEQVPLKAIKNQK